MRIRPKLVRLGVCVLGVAALALLDVAPTSAHWYFVDAGGSYHWGDHPGSTTRRVSFYDETGNATWNSVTTEWCKRYTEYYNTWVAQGVDLPRVVCFTSGGHPGSGNEDTGIDFVLTSLSGYTGEGGYISVYNATQHGFRGTVRIDPAKPLVSTLNGKKAVFCHEMGHALGLAHAHSANNSCLRNPASASVRWYNCHDDCDTWRPMYNGHAS